MEDATLRQAREKYHGRGIVERLGSFLVSLSHLESAMFKSIRMC